MSARLRPEVQQPGVLRRLLLIAMLAALVAAPSIAAAAGWIQDLRDVDVASVAALDPVADLPLVLLPARKPSPVMAIIYSGDGGWRDLDKEIGEKLQAMGIPVVGFDTLKYFWEKKSPELAAATLAAIIDRFTQAWAAPNVALIGYSFGADVLPFMMNRLPDAERARVRQVSLLALGLKADFEIHVGSWLGASPSENALPIAPELRRLDPELLQCVYGSEERDETACVPLAQAEVIETPGGHHFDGDYDAITQRIVGGLVRRGGRCRPQIEAEPAPPPQVMGQSCRQSRPG